MDSGASYRDRDVDTCPYFAGSTAAAGSRTCLAGDKAVSVSRRYAESYCTSRLHVECSLYVGATGTSSDADVSRQPDASAPGVRDTSSPSEAEDEDRRTFGRSALVRWAVGGLVAALALLVALLLTTRRGDETSPGTAGDAPNGAGVPTAIVTRSARVVAMPTVTAALPAGTAADQPTTMIGVAPTRAVPTATSPARARATGTPAPAPTATPAEVPAASPTPRATQTPRPPQRLTGLGLPRSRWEAAHGAAESEVGGLFYYEGRRYRAGYTAGRVVSIARDWGVQQGVAIGTARARARALLPEDAVLVRTDTPADNLTVEVYTSQSLLRAFPPGSGDSWPGRRTGTASVVYRQTDGLVDSITVLVGELLAET